MDGNGYYPENDQGWGNTNRRSTPGQGGLYGTDSFMQRGLYDYSGAPYSGDITGSQRLTGFGGNSMGSSQRMGTSGMYGSDMGAAQRMSYGFGEMDMQDGTGSFAGMDQPMRRGFDDYNGSGMQNSFKPRGDSDMGQKRMLSNYENDMALMQGGSYAGSTPYSGKNTGKGRGRGEEFSGSQDGGNYNAFGQKGSMAYKSVAPPETGPFPSEFDSQNRPFGFQGFDSGPRKSNFMFDDDRYRLGAGGPGPVRGRGRGRGRNAFGGDWQNKGMKRDSGFKQGGPWPKKKKSIVQGEKNPVSFLNEIRSDAKFIVSDMEGPSNMPTFRVSLEFDGETYTAAAKSKKLAKRYAAEAALKVYLQTPAAIQLGYSESMIEFSDGAEEAVTQGNDVEPEEKTVSEGGKPTPVDEAALGGKNPVMFLNEVRKDVAYDLKEETGQAHNKNFIMRVTVGGEAFEGSGQSKKIARSAAALEALKGLGLLNKVAPLDQDNKGYQMLQKMGWNGTGLGANEQGITDCIEPVKY